MRHGAEGSRAACGTCDPALQRPFALSTDHACHNERVAVSRRSGSLVRLNLPCTVFAPDVRKVAALTIDALLVRYLSRARWERERKLLAQGRRSLVCVILGEHRSVRPRDSDA